MDPQLLTVKQVAIQLSVAPGTVRKHIKAGRIPAKRVGGDTGDYRIPASWAKEFLSGECEFSQ